MQIVIMERGMIPTHLICITYRMIFGGWRLVWLGGGGGYWDIG